MKPATVAVLESPEDPEYVERIKKENPEHQPRTWNASDCANQLLARYERLLTGHSDEERQEVMIAFAELVNDANSHRAESRRLIRESSGKMIEEDED